MKDQITIVDLDNCISDDRWRLPFIEPSRKGNERYAKYHRLSSFDDISVKNAIRLEDHRLAIVTSRPETYRAQTYIWLGLHEKFIRDSFNMQVFLTGGPIFMRPEGDTRPSWKLKLEMLDTILLSFGSVRIAYDDNEEVISSYRTAGIAAERMFIHELTKDESDLISDR